MKSFVVDASVGIKWMIPEADSADAKLLRSDDIELHVPGLYDIEIGQILWKKTASGFLGENVAGNLLVDSLNLPLNRYPDRHYLPHAFKIAAAAKRTVYDCLYVALASSLKTRAVTGDERLVNALAGTPWAGFVVLLSDLKKFLQ